MIPVFQTITFDNDRDSNCFNACVASILELPLRSVALIHHRSPGNWIEQWRVWLGDKGYKLAMHGRNGPPPGYSIATIHTGRTYPDDDRKAGSLMAHSCVAFNGVIVHDPYPLPSAEQEIKYYTSLVPMNVADKALHTRHLLEGRCIHGYRSACLDCPRL